MDNDLISRSALKKAFEDTVCIEPMPYAFVKQIIDNAPTVEKRPKGAWEMGGFCFSAMSYKCPFCKSKTLERTKFCPMCGADMREVNNG